MLFTGQKEVGWEHVIPKVTLFDSIHNASPAPSEGKLRKQQTDSAVQSSSHPISPQVHPGSVGVFCCLFNTINVGLAVPIMNLEELWQ